MHDQEAVVLLGSGFALRLASDVAQLKFVLLSWGPALNPALPLAWAVSLYTAWKGEDWT